VCGFAGVLQRSRERGRNDVVLQTMGGTLRHRGPDAAGTQWCGPCGLAHQRLSIIDLSPAGQQPMPNEDKTVWIAYNGEIYNFRDLRTRFALDRGHRFRSRTDTEVIVHLYEELGIDCVRELNGMYAFALWDDRSGTLHLARDPFGIKPLFYLATADGFWFASEIKALLAVPGYDPQPDLEALYHYLSLNYVPDTLTAFAGIRELRPGHRLELRAGDLEPKITRFFDITYSIDSAMTETAAVRRSGELLEAAVRRQLVADVPVGVMLSGGMDSSALAALMARTRGSADFHTFSIGFDDPSFDESTYARMVADALGTRHHEIRVKPDAVRRLLPVHLAYIDEPYADGSAIPTFLLAETAKDFVTVLLSGEGGDEFFAGYDTYAAAKIRNWYRRAPAWVRGMVRAGVERLPVSHRKLSFDFKAKRFTRGAELDVAASHFFWRVVLTKDAKQAVLADGARPDAFPPSERLFEAAYDGCLAADDLNRLLYIDYSFHLPDDLMIKNDRMTMAHSLEARVPFTDVDLVQFLSTVPVDQKLVGLKKKHLLRSAMAGLLPKPVLQKKKVGLEMPYSHWMRHDLRDFAAEVLLSPEVRTTGLFDAAGLRKLWDEHQAMKVDHGRALWGLLNYLLWYDLYLRRRNAADFRMAPRSPREAGAV
jgi:asparagine synthase (glutamine-hydrolysing)